MPNFDIDQTIKTPEDFFIDNSTENQHHVTVEFVPASENLELSTKMSSPPEQVNPMISLRCSNCRSVVP